MGCLALTYHPRFELVKNGSVKTLTSKKTVLKSRSDYVFGYSGHEKDNEIKGIGNSLNMGARMLDTRLGRTPTIDPKAALYPGVSPYAYALNTPIQAKDPDGKVVIFINGQHGGSGGKSDYWRVFSNVNVGTRSEKDGFGRWRTSSVYQKQETYAFDKNLMNRIGDHKAIYRDGALGGWRNTLTTQENLSAEVREYYGYKRGAVDAKDIINNLSRDENGNINETIKIVSHSMGGAYAKGYGQALLDYADKNKISGVKIEFEADFAPFQPDRQKAIKHPNMGPTYQFSHEGDGVAGAKPMEGAEQMDVSSDPSNGNGLEQHQINTFENSSQQIQR